MIATQLLMEEDEKEEEAKDDEKEHIPNRTLRYYTDPIIKIGFWLKISKTWTGRKAWQLHARDLLCLVMPLEGLGSTRTM